MSDYYVMECRFLLKDYEYVLKVHTKRLLNGEYCYFNKKHEEEIYKWN